MTIAKNKNLDAFFAAYTPDFKHAIDNEFTLKAYAQKLSDSIKKAKVRRVLSLGLGHRIVSGELVKLLEAGFFNEYIIIEGSEQLIEQFRQEIHPNCGQFELVHTWFEQYRPSAHFDAIEMGFVLEHVENPALTLARFRDFLAPGGTLFIAVPNARSLHRRIGKEAGLLPDLYQLSPSDYELGHRRYFDLPAIIQLVENAGYAVTKQHGLLLKPLTTQQLLDLNLSSTVWDAFAEIGYSMPDIANSIYLEATR